MTGHAALRLGAGGEPDLDGVMKVMNDSFDPAYGEAWTRAQLAGLLPLPGVWLTLARTADAIVGFALSRAVAGEAELLLLAVAQANQGRGVGRALLERFSQEAAARGADYLHLEVRDGNPAARLYEKAGYRTVGRRRNYYHGPGGICYDAVTLARTASARI